MKPLLTIVLLVLPCLAEAQSYAGDAATAEPIMIVDKPSAGLLKRGTYFVSSNLYQNGGVLVGVSVGLFEPFSFGISYGGTNIIGSKAITMNPNPGVNAKLRIVDEGAVLPAIAIGFDSQGKEPYIDSLKRYSNKSPGAYVAFSRNYTILGNLSLHGGFALSMERDDGDRDLDPYFGIEKSLGKDISILAEYDFGLNDNNNRAIGKGKGYLNFAFRWSWGKGLMVGFDLKNVTRNQDNVNVGNRTLQIEYIGGF
jgi:hypothetical protein